MANGQHVLTIKNHRVVAVSTQAGSPVATDWWCGGWHSSSSTFTDCGEVGSTLSLTLLVWTCILLEMGNDMGNDLWNTWLLNSIGKIRLEKKVKKEGMVNDWLMYGLLGVNVKLVVHPPLIMSTRVCMQCYAIHLIDAKSKSQG